MSMHEQLQSKPGTTEFAQEVLHLLRGVLEVARDRRWLSTHAAAVYAGYDTDQGWLEFAPTVGIQPIRRGRALLWDRLDIDAAFERLKSHRSSSSGSTVTRRQQ